MPGVLIFEGGGSVSAHCTHLHVLEPLYSCAIMHGLCIYSNMPLVCKELEMIAKNLLLLCLHL